MSEILHRDITDRILRAYYRAYNNLGHGFLEKVCQRALAIELSKQHLRFSEQHELNVLYDGTNIGHFIADFLIEDKVIVELKSLPCIIPEHDAQLLNYLSASDIEVGLLLNFGHTPEFKRRVFSNDRKPMRVDS